MIYNSDASNMFIQVKPPMRPEDVHLQVDQVAVAGVTTLFACPNFGQVMNYPTRVGEMFGAHVTPEQAKTIAESAATKARSLERGAANLKALVDAGHDPLGLVIERARQKKLEVFITFRLNEVHYVETPDQFPQGLMVSRSWREHPQWRLGKVGDELAPVYREIMGPKANPVVSRWLPGGWDFAVPEVRARRLAELRECCERYPIDGLDLDFHRFPMYFRPGTERANIKTMTEWVRQVRDMTRAVGRQRGRPFLLSARVMTRPEQNQAIGLDPVNWAKDGLIDFVIASHYFKNDFPLPIADYRKVLPSGVPLYASIEVESDPADYRRVAGQLWQDKVDGIAFFNFFNSGESGREPDFELLKELGDPAKTRKQPPPQRPAIRSGPGGPYKVIAADFTGDQIIDLALAYHGVGLVTVETGDSSGQFAHAGLIESHVPSPSQTYGVYNFDHADIDKDGLPDLACAFFGIPPDEWKNQDIAPDLLRAAWHGNIVIARNTGRGQFQKMAEFETESIATAVRLVDLDRDGRLDLAYTARGSGYIGDLAVGRLLIRQGLGNWKFGPAQQVDAGPSAYNVEIADLNNDGFLDILVPNEHANTVTYFLNPGKAIFTNRKALSPRVIQVGRLREDDRPAKVNHVRAADFNGDGHIDLVTANLGPSTISVFLGNGDGTFQKDSLLDGGKNCAFLDVADLDSDGDVDFVVTHWTEDFISVFLNNGKGTFAPRKDYKTASGNYGVTLCDLDRDGKLDVVTANYRACSISVLKGIGDGTFRPAVTTTKGRRLRNGKWVEEEDDKPVLRSNWPCFRGPDGNGHSREVNLLTEWGPTKNLTWKTKLPGVGASSPVVWGDRIFLTASQEKGHQRLVLCINRGDGSIRWQQVVSKGDPGASHELNQHASSTCVTDGQHVWSFFGKGGLFCHDLDGKLVWERQLGDFLSMWGTAASPILHGDKLIVNCDQDTVNEYYPPLDGPSKASLVALSKQKGATIWQTPRAASRGWSTPVVVRDPAGRDQIVLNGPDGVRAYDPESGRDLWRFRRTVLFGEPCVVAGHGLVFGLAGRDGPMAAIRQGGEGNVTETATAWNAPRQGRDITSPLLVGDHLYTATMAGIATCYDARTGNVLWRERLGKGYTASFVAADGKIYLLARNGTTTVFESGPKLKVLTVNNLDAASDEDFLASPAVSNGQIFIRSDRVLYCVGTPR